MTGWETPISKRVLHLVDRVPDVLLLAVAISAQSPTGVDLDLFVSRVDLWGVRDPSGGGGGDPAAGTACDTCVNSYVVSVHVAPFYAFGNLLTKACVVDLLVRVYACFFRAARCFGSAAQRSLGPWFGLIFLS